MQGPYRRRARCSTAGRSTRSPRILFHARRQRRPGAARRERRQELPGQHRARHGLHLRRHRHQGRRHAARRDAAADRRATRATREVIFPYIGGEEVNDEPDTRAPPLRHQLRRPDEEECRRRWPDLMAIVEDEGEARARCSQKRRRRRESGGGSIGEHTTGAASARSPTSSACSCTRQRQPALGVRVPADADGVLRTRSSCFHSMTLRRLLRSPVARRTRSGRGSSARRLKDDLRYTPSDCFETFPFPDGLGVRPSARGRRPGLLRVPRRR